MKQINLFGEEYAPMEGKYSTNVEAPVYTPTGVKPHLLELRDKVRANKLIHEIKMSFLAEEEKDFLIDAATRHIVFNYEKIADYYAHSDKTTQEFMERSGLVIIDFNKAIEYGYVKLCDDIRSQYLEEYGK